MNQRDAMKMALEALEYAQSLDIPHLDEHLDALDNLRTALAEPEQEPPPKMRLLPCCGYHDGRAVFWNRFNGVVQCHSCGQQYAPHPPQRKPLTDEEIRDIAKQYALGLAFPYDGPTTPELFARAIERAHGIGGEA